jgi:hypothetical protein
MRTYPISKILVDIAGINDDADEIKAFRGFMQWSKLLRVAPHLVDSDLFNTFILRLLALMNQLESCCWFNPVSNIN